MEKLDLSVQLVTFNCCLSTWVNGALARASRMADGFYSSIAHCDVDVICLQELVIDFEGVASRFIHHKHHTAPLKSSWYTDNYRPWPSGLCILSRWPIVAQDGYIFKGPSYHWEKLMAKGILYAKIQTDSGRYIHVFNTHLQAWTNEAAIENRKQQMLEIGMFMREKLEAVDLNQELVVCGLDSNIDLFEHAQQIKYVFGLANMKVVKPGAPMFSFDPSHNPLGASDDPREYRLRENIHNHQYSSTTTTTCNEDQNTNLPKQLIDFFAILKWQKKKIEFLNSTVVPIQTVSPFFILMNMNRQISIRALSDHSAVRTTFLFKQTTETGLNKHGCIVQSPFSGVKKSKQKRTIHYGWMTTTIILFLVCFVFIFWLLLFFLV